MAKTILLADDSVTIQKVVELTFMDEDYHVVATGDGATALEQVPELDPDLVIADVHMPGADGYEVCRQTKATHPTIPVLLLVGTFEQFDEQRAAEVRADGHLKKPFDSQDLLSQVETLISGSAKAAGTPEPAAAEAPAPAAAAEADVFEFDDSPPPVGDLEPPPLEMPGESLETPVAEAVEPDFFSSPLPSLDTPAVPEPMAAAAEPAAVAPEEPTFEPPAVDLEAPTHQVPTIASASGAAEDLEFPPLEAPAIEDFAPAAEPVLEAAEPVLEAAEPVLEVAAAAAAPVVEAADAAVDAAAESTDTAVDEAAEAAEATEPVVEAAAAVEPAAEAVEPAAATANGSGPLSDEDVERIAKRVAELVGEKALRDVAWEVLPDLAEVIIKERIRELESQVV